MLQLTLIPKGGDFLKKFVKILILGVLMLTLFAPGAYANPITNGNTDLYPIEQGEDYSIKTLVDSENYRKWEFTNNKTGEIEYLIGENKGEKLVYTSISSENEKTLITRTEEGVTVESKNKEDRFIPAEKEEPSENKVLTNTEDQIGTMVVPNPGSGEWRHAYSSDYYGSGSLDTTIMSVGVGIIVAIATMNWAYGGIAGVATTIVSGIWAAGQDEFWYLRETYISNTDPKGLVRAKNTKYYAYPDYTNYKGSLWAE